MGMDAPEGSFTEGHALLADDIFFKAEAWTFI